MKRILVTLCLLIVTIKAIAHPMNSSVLAFSVNDNKVNCTLQIPLKELQFAVDFDVTSNTENLFTNHRKSIENYIHKHFRIKGMSGKTWEMTISDIKLEATEESDLSFYQELIVNIVFIPSTNYNTRRFTIFYDAVIHQMVTHKAIVSIKQDWQNGVLGHGNSEIGIIRFDVSNQIVKPFVVELENGNNWKGFKAMFWLGIDHIAEGVDHLMFLLLLLLPAPLLVVAGKWNNSQSWKSSFIKILKIVTGFTIGHSVTLFIGTMQWFEIPILVVEVIVAISIFVTAIHALKPIFYKREIMIAVGFGLIHGLAFSQTLVELELTSTKMFLSLLGFNLGVEAMQLFVIVVVMPFLVYLSRRETYQFLRISLAFFGMMASMAWITELLTDMPNKITDLLAEIPSNAHWLILLLMVLSAIQFVNERIKKTSKT